MRRTTGIIASMLASAMLGLLVPELIYRTYLGLTTQPSFNISPTAYSQFDERFGQRFTPGTKLSLAYVKEGKLAGCLDEISSANADGLGGRDTLADFGRADLKIVSTGDSFTHWKQSKTTIPDAVADKIRADRGITVANLNFGRGAFGLTHMLNIVAGQTELRPHAIVIQFITDDLTRAWWFTKAHVDEKGRSRALLAPTREQLADPARSNDEYIVEPRATPEWCRARLAAGGTDAVLDEAFTTYRNLEKSRRTFPQPLLYERLIQRFTGRHFFAVPSLPRIYSVGGMRADPRYAAAVAKLRASGIPILLVHLPVAYELQTGTRMRGHQSTLLAAIEEDLGVKTTWLHDSVTKDKDFKWDLLPLDPHPSIDGIKAYGQAIAAVVMKRLEFTPPQRH